MELQKTEHTHTLQKDYLKELGCLDFSSPKKKTGA